MKLLETLLQKIDVKQLQGSIDIEINGIQFDSRKIEPGNLFVAVEGFKTDGHRYVAQACKDGAVAVIMQNDIEVPPEVTKIITPNSRLALALLAAAFYDFPAHTLKMIGVTGTNGKTTSTYLLEGVLREAGYKTGIIGTIANKIGDRVLEVGHTTPESLDLQDLLHQMVAEGIDYTVMEVSSHALALDRVAGVEYDVAIFTNFTQDHLDFHPNLADYLAAKTRLFSGLKPHGNKSTEKVAVINVDDPHAQSIITQTKVKVLTYGIKNDAEVRAFDVEIAPAGARFKVQTPVGETTIQLKLTGYFSVYNALGVIAACASQGISLDIIKSALEKVPGVPGRFESVDAGQPFAVIVDYAHTPDSLENVLKTAREFTKNRLIAVFGCGGDRDRTKRPIMGETGTRLSDIAIITSDNPRTEDPMRIIADIMVGVQRVNKSEGTAQIIADRKEAIIEAVAMAGPGDVVLIAGKGHETYQIIGDQVLAFDDRKVAREALKRLLKNFV